MRLIVLAACAAFVSCAAPPREALIDSSPASPYLLIFAGDQDEASSDFLAVVDLRSDSADVGKAIATTPIGMKSSMPHHMEYALPPAGELLFVNAHHHEQTLLVDVSNPRAVRVAKDVFATGAAALPSRLLADAQGDAPGRLLAQRGAEPRSWRDHFTRQLRRHRGVHRRWGAAAHRQGRNTWIEADPALCLRLPARSRPGRRDQRADDGVNIG